MATTGGAWLGQPGHRLLHILAMLNGDIEEKHILGETTLKVSAVRLDGSCFPTEKQRGFPT